MKKGKKVVAAFLSAAIAVSACLPSIAFAESSVNEDDYNVKSILSVSGDTLVSNSSSHVGDSYDGYIQTVYSTDEETMDSSYLSVSYKLGDSVTASDDLQVFNFQPFNTSFGGWDNNYITVGESNYDSSTGVYTAYVATEKVKQSLSTGTFNGINLSFSAEGETDEITLVDYRILSEEELKDEASHQLAEQELILNVQGPDLVDAGYDYDTLQALIDSSGSVTFYVHMSEADEYSWLQSRSGSVNGFNGNAKDTISGSGSGGSNRYLVAPSCTMQSGNYIHINSDGEPIGEAGSGDYVFPDNSIKYNKITTVENFNLSVAIKTTNTEAEVLGFVLSDGTGFTVSYDDEGNATLTMGFEVPDNLESTEDESADATIWPWQQDATKRKENLKLSLDYIATMDSSKYTADSWAALEEAVAVAQKEYDNSSATAESLKEARDTLENVKAKLIFDTETDDSNAQPFRELSAEETIAEMGVGTNLGNTLDGHSGLTPSETSWQCATTTKEYIKALHDAGYNTVRVPVTWGNMINDEDYSINENWMTRVQDIVDYCVEQDMYCIINVHHDGSTNSGGWLDTGADDIDAVMEKYEAVWRAIAERFKDYDEHLIFESMNEVSCGDKDETLKNTTECANYDTPIIVNLNQLFVNTVRSTGSNNTKRWLANVSHYANYGASSLFTMADDSYYNSTNRQMFAFHKYSTSNVEGLVSVLDDVKKKFTDNGIPVYLGEYGTTLAEDSSSDSGYNDVWRGQYSEIVGRACQVAGICPIVWDQGFGNNGELETGIYSYWNRLECRPIFNSTVYMMVRGTYSDVTEENENWDFSDIKEEFSTVEATSITPSADSVTMTVGEYETLTATAEPSNTNDVILWSTDNDKVATVFNGQIHAKGIGTTTVHVYSQSGSVSKDIEVIVEPEESDTSATVTTDADSYSVVVGKGVFIDASASNGKTLSYESSNTDIATVNDMGKIVGIAVGEAYVTITSTTGATKTVKVIVKDALNTDSVELGLMVYYNDSTHSYYSAETGDTVTVSEDGTYTLKFDCATDLSSKAAAAGVTSLSNLTAIYIKDVAVDTGEAKTTPLESCNIMYDKVVVNGTELTVTQTEAKSALKSGPIFDTNDPINAWDGSSVKEVSASSDHVANFTTISNPTTIEITFTLSDMKFTEAAATRDNPATSLKAKSDTEITLCPGTDNDTAEITVKAAPTYTDSLVSFVSDDKSVVQVDEQAVSVGKSGLVTTTIKAVGEGKATVTAMTENGYTVSFVVNCTGDTDIELPVEIKTPDDLSVDELTVEVESSNGEDTQTAKIVDNKVTVSDLTDGTYTLTFSGKNCVSRAYSVTVKDGKVVEDIEVNLHLIGDINGDGKVTIVDMSLMYKHINETKLITDEYELAVADIDSDGNIYVKDYTKLYKHINETKPLY